MEARSGALNCRQATTGDGTMSTVACRMTAISARKLVRFEIKYERVIVFLYIVIAHFV